MQTPSKQFPIVNGVKPGTAPAVAGEAVVSPTLVYRAAHAQREELREQLGTLVQSRHGLLRELEDHSVAGPATTGMQQRIVQLDGRIAEVEIAIAAADARVTQAAAIPGAVVVQPPPVRVGGSDVDVIAPMVALAVFLPLSIAFARRIWRRSAAAAVALPHDLMERLGRLEQTGEATALEVERIGEGQRFVTRLLTERGGNALREGAGIPARESSSGPRSPGF